MMSINIRSLCSLYSVATPFKFSGQINSSCFSKKLHMYLSIPHVKKIKMHKTESSLPVNVSLDDLIIKFYYF